MPLDLMYAQELVERDPTPTLEFAHNLQKNLRDAYDRVRTQMGQKLDRQKALYDEKVHGNPFQENDLVLLHTTVAPKGVGRKLFRPWSGPYRVVKKLSDAVYRIQDTRSSRRRVVVHFDRLKLCPPDVRLPSKMHRQ